MIKLRATFLFLTFLLTHSTFLLGSESCREIKVAIKKAEESRNAPELSLLFKKLGDCYASLGKNAKAVWAYKEAMRPFGALNFQALMEIGDFLGREKKYDLAIQAIEKALSYNPKSIEAQSLLALYYYEKHEFHKSSEFVEAVLKEQPDNADMLLIKAHILQTFAHSETAAEHYRKILAIQEQNLGARKGLIIALISLKQYRQAEEEINKLREIFPDQEKEVQTLLETIEKYKKEDAKEAFRQKIVRARELGVKKCFKEAKCILKALLEKDPCSLEARTALASVLSWEGGYTRALMQINYVLYLDPCYEDALLLKATILRYKMDPRSRAYYCAALSRNDKNFFTRVGLAYNYWARNNYYRANQIVACLCPETKDQVRDLAYLNKYLVKGTALDFIYSHYQDNQTLSTRKYLGTATEWIYDSRFDGITRFVQASQTAVEEFKVRERLAGGELDFTNFASDYLDIGGGIGYAKIYGDSSGNFVIGNARANIYTSYGTLSLGSVYDVYPDTAAALFFKIRMWTNYATFTSQISGKTSVGARYYYVKYSDRNHSNRADVFAQQNLYNGCFQLFLNGTFSYLDFKSQPISFFTPSIISGGHGYFDPKDCYNTQFSLPFYYDTDKLYIYAIPYIGYITYEIFDVHYHGPYYIGTGWLGYRFSPRLLAEGIGEIGLYDLANLYYTYATYTGRLRFVF